MGTFLEAPNSWGVGIAVGRGRACLKENSRISALLPRRKPHWTVAAGYFCSVWFRGEIFFPRRIVGPTVCHPLQKPGPHRMKAEQCCYGNAIGCHRNVTTYPTLPPYPESIPQGLSNYPYCCELMSAWHARGVLWIFGRAFHPSNSLCLCTSGSIMLRSSPRRWHIKNQKKCKKLREQTEVAVS